MNKDMDSTARPPSSYSAKHVPTSGPLLGGGLPPSMYDTSVSTISDSQAQQHSLGSPAAAAAAATTPSETDMYPPYYFPNSSSKGSNGNGNDNGKRSTRNSKKKKEKSSSAYFSYGRELRSTMSEPGVTTTDYDYDLRYSSPENFSHSAASSKSSKSRPRIRETASDVGSLSVSEQIRLYNRHKDERKARTLTTASSYDEHPPRKSRDNGSFPVDEVRDKSRQRRRSSKNELPPPAYTPQDSSFPNQESPSSSFGLRSQSPSKIPSTVRTTSHDVNTSFASSIETQSVASVKELKKQLWDDHEVLHNSRSNTPVRSRASNSRSASPAVVRESTTLDQSFETTDSGGSKSQQKFNSKYFQAALAAQERGRSRASRTDGDSDSRSRSTSRGSRKERVEELIRKAGSYEIQERSRSRDPSMSKSSQEHTNSFSSSHGKSRSTSSRSSPPLPPTPTSSSYESHRHLATSSPNASSHERRVPKDAPAFVASEPRSRTRSREPPLVKKSQPPVLERRRSTSPLVLQRVRDLSSQDRDNVMADHRRRRQQQRHAEEKKDSSPVRPRFNEAAETSFERLALEFKGDVSHLHQGYNSRHSDPPTPKPVPHSTPLSTATSMNRSTEEPMPSWYTSASPVPPTPPRSDVGLNQSIDRASAAALWQEKANTSFPASPSEHKSTASARSKDFGGAYETPKKESAPTERTSRDYALPKNVTDTRTVANLLAKLGAVNREDPTVALAQIDSILKQESQTNGGEILDKLAVISDSMEVHSNAVDETPPLAESDDETSVSSITNPTYAANGSKQQQIQDHVKLLTAPSLLGPELNNSYLEEEAMTNPFGPSTSGFRPPRPSGLQNYAAGGLGQPPQQLAPQSYAKASPETSRTTPRQIGSSPMSKSQEKREMLKRFPPPTTIDVKDISIPSSPLRNQAIDEYPKVKIDILNHVDEPRTPSSAMKSSPRTSKKLDKFIANKEHLAAKIKAWDEMSHGLSKSQASGDGTPSTAMVPHLGASSSLPAPPKAESRRMHPWDGEVPSRLEKVDVRNTSMENEVGIEISVGSRQSADFNKDTMAKKLSDIPVSGSPSNLSAPKNALTPFHSVPAVKSFTEDFDTGAATFFAPDPHGGGWEVTPRMTPEQEKQKKELSNEFDNAWMAMADTESYQEPSPLEASMERPDPPPSAIKQPKYSDLPARRSRSVPRSRNPQRGQGPVDLDDPVDTESFPERPVAQFMPAYEQSKRLEDDTVERGAIEVSLLPGEDMKYLDNSRESSEITSRDSGSRDSKPKKGGFLRNLMRRDKKRQANASPAQRDLPPAAVARTPVAPLRPSPQIGVMRPPPGVVMHEMPPPRGRGRNQGWGGRRSRSASLERFRSSNMAQKFGRVLRLYED